MNPKTNSGSFRAISTTVSVYDPVARLPAEDISAKSNKPRPRGLPTTPRPSMIPGPGTPWAFVICDQDAILCRPDEYWRETVLPIHPVSETLSPYRGKLSHLSTTQYSPISANFRSSKIMKSSSSLNLCSSLVNSKVKSSRISQWVYHYQLHLLPNRPSQLYMLSH